MANLDGLSNLVRPFVKGASDPAIERAIVRALRELCGDSWWLTRLINLTVATGEASSQLVLAEPEQEEIIGMVSVRGRAFALSPGEYEDFADTSVTGTPRAYRFTPPNTLDLYPIPDEDGAGLLIVRVAVQPKLTATAFDEGLVRVFERGIADGALAWMLDQKEASWYDAKEAAARRFSFERTKGAAIGKRLRGNTTRMMRARGPSFPGISRRIG